MYNFRNIISTFILYLLKTIKMVVYGIHYIIIIIQANQYYSNTIYIVYIRLGLESLYVFISKLNVNKLLMVIKKKIHN